MMDALEYEIIMNKITWILAKHFVKKKNRTFGTEQKSFDDGNEVGRKLWQVYLNVNSK